MRCLIAIFTLCVILRAQDAPREKPRDAQTTKPTPTTEQKWYKTEIPLDLFHVKLAGHETASAQGFWQPVSTSKEKQLVDVIATKIECAREERICREGDASILLGVLQVQMSTYDITSWTEGGIVADDEDQCNRHTLAINFKSESVMVTDYPLKRTGEEPLACKPLREASTYALHGGQWQLFPPPPWNPSEWNSDK